MMPEIHPYHLNLLRKSKKRDYSASHIYKEYKKENPVKTALFEIPQAKFIAVLQDFNNMLVKEELIEKGQPLILPFTLGTVWIRKRALRFHNRKYLKIDYEQTKKVGQNVYHMNEHTENHYYKFSWQKSRTHIRGKDRYNLEINRQHKRYFASFLKSGECKVDYYEYLAK